MDRNKIEEYLETQSLPLSKENLHTNIVITFILNMVIYFIFKNMIATIISATLFIIFTIVLMKNKRYLIEHEIYLLVMSIILGYWYWLASLFLFLLQQKHNIHFLLYIIETIFLVASFIYSKYKINKHFNENKHTEKRILSKKVAITAVITGASVITTFRIFFPPSIVSQTAVWYLLCTSLFFFVWLLNMLFANYLIIYIGYLKSFAKE